MPRHSADTHSTPHNASVQSKSSVAESGRHSASRSSHADVQQSARRPSVLDTGQQSARAPSVRDSGYQASRTPSAGRQRSLKPSVSGQPPSSRGPSSRELSDIGGEDGEDGDDDEVTSQHSEHLAQDTHTEPDSASQAASLGKPDGGSQSRQLSMPIGPDRRRSSVAPFDVAQAREELAAGAALNMAPVQPQTASKWSKSSDAQDASSDDGSAKASRKRHVTGGRGGADGGLLAARRHSQQQSAGSASDDDDNSQDRQRCQWLNLRDRLERFSENVYFNALKLVALLGLLYAVFIGRCMLCQWYTQRKKYHYRYF